MTTGTSDVPEAVELPRTMDELTALRRRTPVARVRFPHGGEAWVVLSHQLAREALSDHRLGRSPLVSGDVPHRTLYPQFLRDSLMFTDDPEHGRLRRLVTKWFTSRRIEQLRQWTQAKADELLDGIEASGCGADLIEGFASALPVEVLSHLMGVSPQDRKRFHQWATVLLDGGSLTAEEVEESRTAMADYLTTSIADKRREPQEDLLSGLASTVDADDTLTDAEILPIAMLILAAGFDNTSNSIGFGILALLRRPDQRAAFTADIDGHIMTTVEELIRHARQDAGHGIQIAGTPFVALEDLELGPVRVRAGEIVVAHRTSASHDESVFDRPMELDVLREQNPHLGLSYGIHHCLGAPLARMELQVALASVFKRFPDLRLASEPRFDRPEMLSMPMTELRVAW